MCRQVIECDHRIEGGASDGEDIEYLLVRARGRHCLAHQPGMGRLEDQRQMRPFDSVDQPMVGDAQSGADSEGVGREAHQQVDADLLAAAGTELRIVANLKKATLKGMTTRKIIVVPCIVNSSL